MLLQGPLGLLGSCRVDAGELWLGRRWRKQEQAHVSPCCASPPSLSIRAGERERVVALLCTGFTGLLMRAKGSSDPSFELLQTRASAAVPPALAGIYIQAAYKAISAAYIFNSR